MQSTRSQQFHSIPTSRSPRTSVGEAGREKGTPMSYDYIVGLTDGEGCFYVNIRKPRKESQSAWVETHFYIKMRARDKEVLEEIQSTLGCGKIYKQSEFRLNHEQCYRFEVNNRLDLEKVIIPLFDKHLLRSSKQKEFEWFKEVVRLVKEGAHFTQGGLAKVQQLKQLMSNHRGHRAR